MANSTHRRYHDLDALRAIAMLLGILLHGLMSFLASPSHIQPIQDVDQNAEVYGWVMKMIHGFRMPLFFLVSGFFTTMMWQKRGPSGLIQHRAIRIGVPLVIGTFTLVPVIWWIMIGGSTNLWQAVDQGNETYVQRYIDAGGSLERPLSEQSPGAGMRPLHIAVAKPNADMVGLLIDGGAELDARTLQNVNEMPAGSTALHFAAAMGNEDLVVRLLDSGAEANLVNTSEQTALDLASVASIRDRLTSAGGVAGSELSRDVVEASLAEMSVKTRGPDYDYLSEWISTANPLLQLGALFVFFPVFLHLWFLYYLMWLVFGFVCIAGTGRLLKLRGPPTWLMRRPVAWFWLIPVTIGLQLSMLQTFGPDTAVGLLPWPPSLIYYGVFFGFGAACYGRPELEERLGANWVPCLALALLILPIGIYAIDHRGENFTLYHSIASVVGAFYVWLMCFGLIGLFRRFFARESYRLRYISDSAYWLYLMHLPIVMYLQSEMAEWPIPSALKIALICGSTTIVLLLTYAWFVRYTPIGTVLNGKKTRGAKLIASTQSPTSEPATAELANVYEVTPTPDSAIESLEPGG